VDAIGLILPSCPRAQFDALNDGDRLYLVPEGLLFVWPFVSVGHNVTLPADLLQLPVGHEPIVIESISASPLVFKLHNFFSGAEADELIRAAEAITDPQFMLKRSATGVHTDPDKVVYATTRTSENAFDPNTPTAMTLKRRMFELLRIPEYQEDMADGLQLLRYRQKQAYIPHHDWFDDGADPTFNFDPATGGSNRFATVFLYLSDVELGGQTVFPLVDAPSAPIAGIERDAMPAIATELFNESDWELDVVRKCYSKLSVRPQKATAVLFYSQSGAGVLDEMSLHGACPVLQGTKWGANLWVWNKPRHGLSAAAGSKKASEFVTIVGVFVNRFPGEIELYWTDKLLATIAAGDRSSFNTYHSHEWSAKYLGKRVWAHTISLDDGTAQTFYIDEPADELEVDIGHRDEL
jgi:prolyl 4-hydroxylase